MSSAFHSFPRPTSGVCDLISSGLKTLESFFKIGFVLTPEKLSLNEHMLNGQTGRELTIYQNRICFTEIDVEELAEHSKCFGPFSIEFDLQELNNSGAMPAFYYVPAKDSSNLSGLSEALIMTLGDLTNLTKELDKIKQAVSSVRDDDPVNLKWGKDVAVSLDIPAGFFRHFINYLEENHGTAKKSKCEY